MTSCLWDTGVHRAMMSPFNIDVPMRETFPTLQLFHEKANRVNASSSLSPRCSRVGIHPVLKAPTTLPSALLVISCEIGAL